MVSLDLLRKTLVSQIYLLFAERKYYLSYQKETLTLSILHNNRAIMRGDKISRPQERLIV